MESVKILGLPGRGACLAMQAEILFQGFSSEEEATMLNFISPNFWPNMLIFLTVKDNYSL